MQIAFLPGDKGENRYGPPPQSLKAWWVNAKINDDDMGPKMFKKRLVLILRLFFDFRGRISRETWWLAILAYILCWFMVVAPLALLYVASFSRFMLLTNAVVFRLLGLFIILSFLVINIKRLHDRNFPWWWLLVALIPALGCIYVIAALDFGVVLNRFITLILVLGLIYCIFQVGFKPGDAGTNRYGPPPAFLKTWRGDAKINNDTRHL